MKVKKLLMAYGILLASTLNAGAQVQSDASLGTMSLTLEKAIGIALDENPTIRVADRDVELKKIADSEAWQALLPTLDATLSFSHSIKVAEMKIGGNKIKFGQDGSSTATGFGFEPSRIRSCCVSEHEADQGRCAAGSGKGSQQQA